MAALFGTLFMWYWMVVWLFISSVITVSLLVLGNKKAAGRVLAMPIRPLRQVGEMIASVVAMIAAAVGSAIVWGHNWVYARWGRWAIVGEIMLAAIAVLIIWLLNK